MRAEYCGESWDESEEVAGNWRTLHEEEYNLYTSLHTIVTKSEDKMGESFEESMHIVGRKT